MKLTRYQSLQVTNGNVAIMVQPLFGTAFIMELFVWRGALPRNTWIQQLEALVQEITLFD